MDKGDNEQPSDSNKEFVGSEIKAEQNLAKQKLPQIFDPSEVMIVIDR